jgi:glycosyltransferase involved in cell wall biosynthesis
MGKKKILFLIPSLIGGGAERTLINLLHKTDFKRYEVDLVSVLKKGPYLTEIPKEVTLITLFNNEFFVRVVSYLQKKIGFNLIFKTAIFRKLKKKYDVGISFLDGNFTDLLFFSKKINKRYAWVHSSYETNQNFARFYNNPKYKRKLIEKRYKKLDGIYFVSFEAMDEFIRIFGKYENMDVIFNIIDNQRVINQSKEIIEGFKKTTFTFVAIGSLLPVKGFDRLIRASKIAQKKGFNFKLIILGSGPEEKKLKDLVCLLNLDEFVSFKGFVKNPYPYLKRGDVFVMSSLSEALPTVLIEAMILGKPTLVTNCSGCREIVNWGEFGLMAEQDDTDLAKNMIQYITNKELLTFYSNESLNRAKFFDDEVVKEKYYKVFDQ